MSARVVLAVVCAMSISTASTVGQDESNPTAPFVIDLQARPQFLAEIEAPQQPAPQPPAGTPRPAQPNPPRPGQGVQPGPSPQAGPPPQPGPPPPPPPAPRREGQPINVKVDVTITDQRAGAAPVKKTVSIVTADGYRGSIRTSAFFREGGLGDVPLHVDASPELLPNGKLRVNLTLQYNLPTAAGVADQQPTQGRNLVSTNIQENLAFILDDGKPILAAQSADPVSDRVVTVEVKATILK